MSACGGLRIGSLFITGANRGIGLEFVKQLTRLPQPPKHIFATCRNPSEAKVFTIFGYCGVLCNGFFMTENVIFSVEVILVFTL